jgi:hypothetical protein
VSKAEQRRLLGAFIDAARRGDRAALEALFAADVVSCSDGGGLVRAPRLPVVGRARVAQFIAAVSHFWTGVTLTWNEANGQVCVLVSRDGTVGALVTMHASAQGIDQLVWVMRPSKLAAVARSPGPQEPYSSDPAGG